MFLSVHLQLLSVCADIDRFDAPSAVVRYLVLDASVRWVHLKVGTFRELPFCNLLDIAW